MNPYQPPQARVMDLPQAPKPGAVQAALALLWLSLVGRSIFSVWNATFTSDVMYYGLIQSAVRIQAAVGLLVFGALFMFIAGRRNWARWTWMALAAGVWILFLNRGASPMYIPYGRVVAALFAAMDLIGALLLCFGAGGRWFRQA